MNNIRNPFLFIALILSISGCDNRNEVVTSAETGIPVRIQAVTSSSAGREIEYVGVVEESQSIPLSFLTTGTVEKVLVNEGETVKEGQLLATLNSVSYRNAFQLAAAREKQAQDAFDRLSAVYKEGSLPEIKMVEIETGLEQARAMVQIAKKNQEDCNLYAPANAVVGRRTVEPGMNVIPGFTVITLVKIHKVLIKISIPENEITDLRLDQEVVIRVPALGNEVFTGKLEQKGVMANPLSHTYEVKAGIINKGDWLRPGMVCNVSILNRTTNTFIAVPQQAIMLDDEGDRYVYTVDTLNYKATRKPVTTGALVSKGQVVVTSGLRNGDRVIVDGYQKIHENAQVQIIR